LEFVLQLRDSFRDENKLHIKYIYELLLELKGQLMKSPTVVEVAVPADGAVTVFGDIHGQYYDLLNGMEKSGLPSEKNILIFNGDLVDRGSWSIEVITLLVAFKVLYPNYMHIGRGNHEGKSMTKMYGFEGECKNKYGAMLYELYSEIFTYLPLVHLIGGKVFVTHGGLFSSDGVTLDSIRKINRFREIPDEGIMCELLWSDPLPAGVLGRRPSKRGVAIQFGADVTKRFLDDNGLDLIVRSHEVRDNGYEVEHDGRLITIFSAPNYCDQQGNKAAFVRFSADLKPQFTVYSHVPHPKTPAMHYAPMNGFYGM